MVTLPLYQTFKLPKITWWKRLQLNFVKERSVVDISHGGDFESHIIYKILRSKIYIIDSFIVEHFGPIIFEVK